MSNVIAGVIRGQYEYLDEHIAQKRAICSDGNTVPFSEHIIEPEKSLSFYVEKETMVQYLKSELPRRVFLYCLDSTNKVYKIPLKRKTIRAL